MDCARRRVVSSHARGPGRTRCRTRRDPRNDRAAHYDAVVRSGERRFVVRGCVAATLVIAMTCIGAPTAAPATTAPTAAAAVASPESGVTRSDSTASRVGGCGPSPLDRPYIDSWTERAGGLEVGISVVEIGTGCTNGSRQNQQFFTASIVKLQVMAAVLLRLQDNGEGLDGYLDSRMADMIEVSDNEATNALVSWLGGLGELQLAADRFGMNDTDNHWNADWGHTLTTAADQSRLMGELLVRGGPLNDASRALARVYLDRVEADQRWGVGAIVGDGITVLVKNGWWDNAGSSSGPTSGWRLNSVGLIEAPDGRAWSIALLGNDWADESDRRFLAELAQHIAEVVTAPRSVVAVVLPPPTGERGSLVPQRPRRLLDTRSQGRVVAAGTTMTVNVRGTGPQPTAVAVNITATGAVDAGFLTVFPTGMSRPNTSNLNLDPGRTVANLAITPVGPDGTISVFTYGRTHLIVDLIGVWMPTFGNAVAAGRFHPITPVRVADTRSADGPLGANGRRSVQVAGPGSGTAIADSAVAVIVSVTVVDATADGYWTVWGSGAPKPTTSNVNVRGGQTVANTSIVSPGLDGRIQVFAQSGGQVIVDVVGWFTGPDEPPSTSGLLAPLVAPMRVVDSRFGVGANRLGRQPATVDVGSGNGLVANLTWLYARRPGFVNAWPAGTDQPNTSVANPDPEMGYAFANALITGTGTNSQVELVSSAPVDILLDVSAVFT